ncbi:hypothetical protein GBA52_023734 [Prunus armeniaca]|nr:hypothetical protein GBA52_023734 [Prunus armeniaca]
MTVKRLCKSKKDVTQLAQLNSLVFYPGPAKCILAMGLLANVQACRQTGAQDTNASKIKT